MLVISMPQRVRSRPPPGTNACATSSRKRSRWPSRATASNSCSVRARARRGCACVGGCACVASGGQRKPAEAAACTHALACVLRCLHLRTSAENGGAYACGSASGTLLPPAALLELSAGGWEALDARTRSGCLRTARCACMRTGAASGGCLATCWQAVQGLSPHHPGLLTAAGAVQGSSASWRSHGAPAATAAALATGREACMHARWFARIFHEEAWWRSMERLDAQRRERWLGMRGVRLLSRCATRRRTSAAK